MTVTAGVYNEDSSLDVGEVAVPRPTKSQRVKATRSSRPARSHRNRLIPWLFISTVIVLLMALPGYRWVWRREGSNAIRTGLELIGRQGCVACHRTPAGSLRWRADGAMPGSMESVRDAIADGRPAETGLDVGMMPAYGRRLTARSRNDLALAVGALTGLIGVPRDPELAAGRDIARQMGCFRCHGSLGSGGIANPGSLVGTVPGWFRKDAMATLASPGAFVALLDAGARPPRIPLPWMSGPALTMPAFGARLDSTEMELLRRYLVWLSQRSFLHP